ncbi:MAG: DUF2460 domain-containing protein [Cyanobacteria bacterium J06623_7]
MTEVFLFGTYVSRSSQVGSNTGTEDRNNAKWRSQYLVSRDAVVSGEEGEFYTLTGDVYLIHISDTDYLLRRTDTLSDSKKIERVDAGGPYVRGGETYKGVYLEINFSHAPVVDQSSPTNPNANPFPKPVEFAKTLELPEFIDFAEVLLDLGYDYGVVGGMEFKTEVIEVADGREQRNALRQLPLGRWQLGQRNLLESEADKLAEISYLRDFQKDRLGAKQGFRFKDWADYRATNQLIAVGDGLKTHFQLRKAYIAGDAITYRPIQKPVADTVQLYVDGEVETGWTLDYITGVVSHADPLPNGATLHADFEFDVPVWFESDQLPLSSEYVSLEDEQVLLYKLGSVFVVEGRIPLALPWQVEPAGSISEDLNLGIIYETSEKTEFATQKLALKNGYVRRQDKREESRILFDFGDRNFDRQELDILLSYFWNCKGKAQEFGLLDKADSYLVRFNTDRLNIKFEAASKEDALFKISGLKMQLKQQVLYRLPPFSIALQPIVVNPQDPNDPYTNASGQSGGGAGGSGSGGGAGGGSGSSGGGSGSSFTVSSFSVDFNVSAPPVDPNRRYRPMGLFWEAGALHWLINGDNRSGSNLGRNRIFYYRSRIENGSWYLDFQEHDISELVFPADISIIKTSGGTGITFRARRQPTPDDPLEDTARYVFEVLPDGETALYSQVEATTGDSGAEVTAILGSKIFTDNGIAGGNVTGSYLWSNLAGLDFVPIKNSVKPGSPIMENYHESNNSYNPANNVVDREEQFNVWGDERPIVRDDGNNTIRIYAVNGQGEPEILYEYTPISFSSTSEIARSFNEDNSELLKISGIRCNSNNINCATEDRYNFTRFYFRERQQEDWRFIDEMDTQTSTSNPTKIIQDLTAADPYGQFDRFGNILKNSRSRYWFYKPGSSYGIDLVSTLFGGASAVPYEFASSYGVAATPYGLLCIAGRPNGVFLTQPKMFIVQAEDS